MGKLSSEADKEGRISEWLLHATWIVIWKPETHHAGQNFEISLLSYSFWNVYPLLKAITITKIFDSSFHYTQNPMHENHL